MGWGWGSARERGVEREREPNPHQILNSHLTSPPPRLATYRLAIHTSDLRAAGTSANVWVQLHGAAGSSGVQKLQVGGI